MEFSVIASLLLPLFLLFNLPFAVSLTDESCNGLRVIFSGSSCTLDSKTYRQMISTTENYLCENVAFLGSTLKKHYFLTTDNKITTYIHDNDISQKEIEGFDLKDYAVIKAAITDNMILLEAVNSLTKDIRSTIVLNNFEAEKINGRVYDWGNANQTLCILSCNKFYIIKAVEHKLIQQYYKFNANEDLENNTVKVLANYEENIDKIYTTNSITIYVKTKSGKTDHIDVLYDNTSEAPPPPEIKHIQAPLLTSPMPEESSDFFNIKISKNAAMNVGYGFIIFMLIVAFIVYYIYKNKICSKISSPKNSGKKPLHSGTNESTENSQPPIDQGSAIKQPLLTNNQTNPTTAATQTEDADDPSVEKDTSLAPK